MATFLLILLAALSSTVGVAQPTPPDPYAERPILLRIKSQLNIDTAQYSSDPLAAWSAASPLPHCNWTAVTCTSPAGRVTALSFSNFNFSAAVPSSLCDLPALSSLDLSLNYFYGPFPVALYRCQALAFLDLSLNYFVGPIPPTIHRLSPATLRTLALSGNNFTGDFPSSIASLTGLASLKLDNNLFHGSYPPEIGRLSNLEELVMSYNPFAPAPIPPEFGGLTSLKRFLMRNASVSGELPSSLSNLTKLELLDLAFNSIAGRIPSWVWQLQQLQKLYLYSNRFSGDIVVGGAIKATGLIEMDLSSNALTGSIPEQFGQLEKLTTLVLYFNDLSGVIPESIGRLPNLHDVRLFNNRLSGRLPPELGKYSRLSNFEVSNNFLSGELPEFLCANKALADLVAFNNSFSGELPQSIAECFTLDNIQLFSNNFTGDFPKRLWTSAPALTTVLINNNGFSGELPPVLSPNLSNINIGNNRFSGAVPTDAVNLFTFSASSNSFTGVLPKDMSKLSKLQTLQLADNSIAGDIPESISALTSLTVLDLAGNHLSGGIPASLGSLPVLTSLDLSRNELSGNIPATFNMLRLNQLNLSSNQLSGEIPASLQIAFPDSFLGNPGLCKDARLCNGGRSGSQYQASVALIAMFSVLAGMALLGAVAIGVLMVRRRSRQQGPELSVDKWKLTSFHKGHFAESDIIRGLSNEENEIGSGGSGKVYRVSLSESFQDCRTVAVKKLWSSRKRMDDKSEKEFEAEVKILGSIRHANIVKLLCCISSDDAKLLVYEYMENGSLDRWLHGRQAAPLEWPTRLGIAIDAARGLAYMHHDCVPPIVHRDIKTNNILLDPEFRAKIADFGLARILVKAGEPETVSALAGSFGYMAPEYGKVWKINEKIDVYSFGVVLLELTTGRRANKGDEHTSLAEWAWRQLEEGGKLGDMVDADIRDPAYLEEIEVVLGLGVRCTAPLPLHRPTMKEVLKQLVERTSGAKQGNHGEHDAAPLLMSRKGSRRKSMSEVSDGSSGDNEDSGSFFVRVV